MGQYTVDGITWNYTLSGSDATIGTGSSSTNGNATTSGTGITGAITIPDTVDGYTVKAIGIWSFRTCYGLTSVIIPDSVTTIGDRAFFSCIGLTSFTIPNLVTAISSSSFQACAGLTSFTMGNSVTTIGPQAFAYCAGLTSFTIPDSVVTIENSSVFYGCTGLTSITIGNSVITIGNNAFNGCTGLTSINLPDSVTTIGINCFTNTHADLIVTMNTKTIDATTYNSPTTTDIAFFGNTSVTLVLPPTVAELFIAGVTIAQLVAAGVTIEQLVAELFIAGVVTIAIAQLVAAGVTVTQLLASGITQTEIDIGLANIKIQSDFTISDGTSSSVFFPEIISPDNPFNTPNVFTASDAKTTTSQLWQDIEISSTGQYQIAVVGGVQMDNDSAVTAVTGNVWISTDYGETWLEKTGNDQVSGAVQQWTNAMISADGSIMMVNDIAGLLYRSEDGGVSWTQKTITNYVARPHGAWSHRLCYKIIMSYDGQTLIIGTAGIIDTANAYRTKLIISTDGGTNWADLTSLSSGYEYIIDYHMSKSGKYIIVIFNNSTRPKYSDDFGATFISITDTNFVVTTDATANLNIHSRGVCAISDNGYVAWFTRNSSYNEEHSILNLNSGTVTNGENDGTWTTTATNNSGWPWGVSISNNGQYIMSTQFNQDTNVFISVDYGTTFTTVNTANTFVGYVFINNNMFRSICYNYRFSDDNKYIAAVQPGIGIYVRKNTTIPAEYTLPTFAAKLTTDLGYAVNAGGDLTTTDSTPYYRLYLQFANAVTLTGMPKDIFNIPFSDFSVGAGGQVNLRNVNLDAQMTIATSYDKTYTFGQVGDMFLGENAGDQIGSCSMSADGTIVAVGEKYYDTGKGRAAIYKYSGGSWVKMGAYIDGTVAGGYFGDAIALSEDGSIVVIGGQISNSDIGLIRMFQYSTPGIIGGSWTQIGEDIHGLANTVEKFGVSVAISNDGSIVAAGAYKAVVGGNVKGTVRVYQYKIPTSTEWSSGNVIKGTDTTPVADKLYWTQLSTDINGDSSSEQSGSNISLNGNGNIISIGAEWYGGDAGRVKIFQYIGGSWSQLGPHITFGSKGRTKNTSLSDDGTIIAVGGAMDLAPGMVRVFQYSDPGQTNGAWNQIGNDMPGGMGTAYIRVVAMNGDGTILVVGGDYYSNRTGYVKMWQYDGSSWIMIKGLAGPHSASNFGGRTSISRDGSLAIIGADGYDVTSTELNQGCAFVYQVPATITKTNTSTIPAGNNFINNFVNTLDTDLANLTLLTNTFDYTLSYDASNALITLDGLAQDISMSITSTDTTVFDTSMTEITVAENKLPFITYGQSDPTFSQYNANGITTSEFVSNGYTIPQLLIGGFIPDWTFDTDANHLAQSYVKDFIDISGSLALRENASLTVNGNIETKGNVTIKNRILEADLSLNHNIFVVGDISMNGNVTVGDVSMNGKVVDCSFTDSSIPESAFIGTIPSPDYTQPTIMYEKGFDTTADVSMNANVQINNLKVDGNVEFSDGTTMNTYDDNKESSGTTFKASTFTSLDITNTLTAGTFSTSSDYRIKTDISQLDETITLDNLRPVKYLQTLINKPQYGFIAHELQEYYPDLVVGEKDGEEWQRVNYTGLVALLINEIKQLKRELTELENGM